MLISSVFFVFGETAPQWAMASSFTKFLDHTQRCTTVSRTPLDEWSARRRDLYLTKHNTTDNIHDLGWNQTHKLNTRAVADPRLGPALVALLCQKSKLDFRKLKLANPVTAWSRILQELQVPETANPYILWNIKFQLPILWPRGLKRGYACWDWGFESYRFHVCLQLIT